MVCVKPKQGFQIVSLRLELPVVPVHLEVRLPMCIPGLVVVERAVAVAPVCEVDFVFLSADYVLERKSTLNKVVDKVQLVDGLRDSPPDIIEPIVFIPQRYCFDWLCINFEADRYPPSPCLFKPNIFRETNDVFALILLDEMERFS